MKKQKMVPKPCPLGHKVRAYWFLDGSWRMTCSKCRTASNGYGNEKKAIAAWNMHRAFVGKRGKANAGN